MRTTGGGKKTMAQDSSVGERLAALSAVEDDLASPEARKALRQGLGDSSNYVVERAAQFIARTEDAAYTEPLVKAYWRLKRNPLKKDPGCLGKTAIVKALVALEHADADLFRDGIVYEQIEPKFFGEADSAAELRGACALGLVDQVPALEVLNRCATLLVDPCVLARSGAAQALGILSQPEGAPLLRLKLLQGDEKPEVMGECCAALLKLDRAGGLEFVARFLFDGDSDLCVQAALAVAESRLPGTFELLRRTWERRVEEAVRESLLLCIGLLRTPESRDFLLSIIRPSDLKSAEDALKALKLHGTDAEQRQAVDKAIDATGEPRLRRVFLDEWGLG